MIGKEKEWVDISSEGDVFVDGVQIEEPYPSKNEKGISVAFKRETLLRKGSFVFVGISFSMVYDKTQRVKEVMG